MKFSIGLILGGIIGAVLSYATLQIWSYTNEPSYVPDEIDYEKIFAYSNAIISDENFLCEDPIEKRVGSVLGSIFKSNSNSYLNRINESCISGRCEIGISNCTPWKTEECGSTILIFSVRENGEIDKNSFGCLQVP